MPAKLPLRNVWLPRIALGLAAMAATIALVQYDIKRVLACCPP